MSGIPPDTLVGRSPSEFVPEERVETIRHEAQERQRGRRSTYEIAILRRDRAHRHLLVTATPQYEAAATFPRPAERSARRRAPQ